MLMIKSRIAASDRYKSGKLKNAKLNKCMTTLYYFMIGAFVVVQAVLIVAALFSWIKLEAFYAEITGYTGALILGLNIYLMFTYCRLTGTPYKTRKHFQAVRWIGLIGGYWSLAFGMKFCSVILGSSLY